MTLSGLVQVQATLGALGAFSGEEGIAGDGFGDSFKDLAINE